LVDGSFCEPYLWTRACYVTSSDTPDFAGVVEAEEVMAVSLIERMARAMCMMDGIDPDRESFGCGGRIPRDQKYKLWEAHAPAARAALAETCVPTERMVDAAKQYRIEEVATGFDCDLADVLETAIDAELKDASDD
jgi:hypothetical protein